jgi:hypothetical protein
MSQSARGICKQLRCWNPGVALIAVLLELVIRRAVAARFSFGARTADGVGCLVRGDFLHLIAGVSRSAQDQTQTHSCQKFLNVIGNPLGS